MSVGDAGWCFVRSVVQETADARCQNEYLKFLLVNDQMFHELVGGLCE
jgi:hypothetical protein